MGSSKVGPEPGWPLRAPRLPDEVRRVGLCERRIRRRRLTGGFGGFVQPPLQRIDLLLELVMLLLQRVQLGVERQHMGLDRTGVCSHACGEKGKGQVVLSVSACDAIAIAHQGCPPLGVKFASPYRHGRLRRQGQHSTAHD